MNKKVFHLGTFDTYEEAVQAREEAERHVGGDFVAWHQSMQAQRKTRKREKNHANRNKHEGVTYSKKNNRYNASIRINDRLFRLGSHDTYEAAVQAREEAERHIGEDFAAWYQSEYRQKTNNYRRTNNRNTSGHTGVFFNKVRNKFQAHIAVNKKVFHLGTFDTYEAAVQAREEAERHVGEDFAAWHQSMKRQRKAGKPNTSGHVGVFYHKRTNKYTAYIYVGIRKKTFSLGYYDTYEEAVQAREEAELHLDKDFDSWYQSTHSLRCMQRRAGKSNTSGHIGVSYNKTCHAFQAYITVNRKNFRLGNHKTYEAAAQAREEAERHVGEDFTTWYQSIYGQRKTGKPNTSGHVGVSYNKRANKYSAYIYVGIRKKTFSLGYYDTYEEAVQAREEAELHLDKDFDSWYQSTHSLRCRKRRAEKPKTSGDDGVSYSKKYNRYYTSICVNDKLVRLGSYKTYEEAVQAREEAEQRVDEEFLAWHQSVYGQRKTRKREKTHANRNKHEGVAYSKKTNRYNASIRINDRLFRLGSHDTYEAAVQAREEAERHAGEDFAAWHQSVYGQRKRKTSRHKNSKTKGVAYRKNINLFQAYIGVNKKNFSLGCYKTYEAAVQAREEAERHVGEDFVAWHQSVYGQRTRGKPNTSGHAGVVTNKRDNNFRAQIIVDKRNFSLGSHDTYEEAVQAREEAERHVGKDFLSWYQSVHANNSRNTSGHTGVFFNKERNKFQAYISVNKKVFHLGSHDTYEEAVRVREEAERHVGKDFLAWYRLTYNQQRALQKSKKGDISR